MNRIDPPPPMKDEYFMGPAFTPAEFRVIGYVLLACIVGLAVVITLRLAS